MGIRYNVGIYSAPSHQLPKHPDGFPIYISKPKVFSVQCHGIDSSMGKYRSYVA